MRLVTKTDLFVLGASGERKPHLGTGTLASSCVRSVPTGVLIVRDNYPDAFRTVVVGIDFAPTGRRALETALKIAQCDGAKLYPVHVLPQWPEACAPVSAGLSPDLHMFVSTTAS